MIKAFFARFWVFLLWLLVTAFLALGAWHFSRFQTALNLSEDWVIVPRGDIAEGGQSRVVSWVVSEGGMAWVYRLDSAYQWPYAGILLQPKHKGCLDWTRYDSLQFEVIAEKTPGLTWSMETRVDSLTLGKGEKFRTVSAPFTTKATVQSVGLSFDDFGLQEWYKIKYALPAHGNTAGWSCVQDLILTAGYYAPVGVEDRVEVRKIKLVGHRSWPWPLWFGWMLGSLLSLVFWFARLWVERRERDVIRQQILVQKQTLDPKHVAEWDRLRDYFAEHYAREEFSLEDAARACGVSRRKLTALIQEQLGMTPSAYLNELRLLEASRLLANRLDLSVSAVAYEVGFTSAPHFNRLFRARFDVSPTEWRKQRAV